jgi:septal ring factor EnvC (AmiA/AmiB activator)
VWLVTKEANMSIKNVKSVEMAEFFVMLYEQKQSAKSVDTSSRLKQLEQEISMLQNYLDNNEDLHYQEIRETENEINDLKREITHLEITKQKNASPAIIAQYKQTLADAKQEKEQKKLERLRMAQNAIDTEFSKKYVIGMTPEEEKRCDMLAKYHQHISSIIKQNYI